MANAIWLETMVTLVPTWKYISLSNQPVVFLLIENTDDHLWEKFSMQPLT